MAGLGTCGDGHAAARIQSPPPPRPWRVNGSQVIGRRLDQMTQTPADHCPLLPQSYKSYSQPWLPRLQPGVPRARHRRGDRHRGSHHSARGHNRGGPRATTAAPGDRRRRMVLHAAPRDPRPRRPDDGRLPNWRGRGHPGRPPEPEPRPAPQHLRRRCPGDRRLLLLEPIRHGVSGLGALVLPDGGPTSCSSSCRPS